jgi:hypothetical protein
MSRMAALAGAACFAVVAVGSALDRYAVYQPDTPIPVPAPFAAQSLSVKLSQALASRDPAAMEAQAQSLITRQPINAFGPAVLGYAHALVGDVAGADAVFTVAGQMGWRSPLTQEYWMQRALAMGDNRVAALRLDGLLRQTPALVANSAIIDPFETNPAARAAFLARMTLRPNWLARYVSDVDALPPQQTLQRAAMLGAMAGAGVGVSCQDARAVVERLVAQGAPQNASTLWRSLCPSPHGAGGLLWDGAMVQVNVNGAAASFSWMVDGAGDVDVVQAPQGVDITTSSNFPVAVLRQLVVPSVAGAAYRLTWSASDGTSSSLPRVSVRLGCTPDTGQDIAPQAAGSGRWQADLTFPAQCQAAWLRFVVRPGTGAVHLGGAALTLAR